MQRHWKQDIISWKSKRNHLKTNNQSGGCFMDIQKLARKEMSQLSAYVPGIRSQEAKEKYGLDKVIKRADNERDHYSALFFIREV